ncbi:MAG TPA: hypothetical protein VD833_18530 [Vicinamibacterales bacterium]|nr:hypothetical protein [Vicinamibacterales bacterium]
MKTEDCRAARSLSASALTAVLLMLSASAQAQQVVGGPTSPLYSSLVRGVDTASDPFGNYLVAGGQGQVIAACINGQGSLLTGGMTLNATVGGYASFPRATYSPHLFGGGGGFMVVWAEAPGNPDAVRQLFARPVSCAGVMGPAQVVANSTWWEPGNIAIAYSSASQVFLVAWRSFPDTTIKMTRTNLAGVPLDGAIQLSPGGHVGRDPSVTWNWNTNHFGVSFSGETHSAFATVPAWNPGAFTRNTFQISGGIYTTMTDVAFNPRTGRYIMAWFELSSGAFARAAEFDAFANLTGTGVASTRLGSYDALGLAVNYVTGTFLLAGVDRSTDAPLGLELNMRGFPFNGENTLSNTRPSYYPRVSASRTSPTWNVVFSGGFVSLSSLIATGFTFNGGPAGSYDTPAPAPAPAPTPSGTSCPGTAPAPGWICLNGGWVPPDSPLLGSAPLPPPPPPPPSSSCPGTAPVAGWVCVNGGWVPPDHPLATGGSTAPAPSPAPSPTTCTTPQPGPEWTCVNGGWLPWSMLCPSVRPGPNWTCRDGGWWPPQ